MSNQGDYKVGKKRRRRRKKEPPSQVGCLCAKVSVRSGTRTAPYAADGSNPGPVQHRSGGDE